MKLTVLRVEALKDVDEQLLNYVQQLEVMLMNGHLKVQTCEFTQMPVCVGVFRPAHAATAQMAQDARST